VVANYNNSTITNSYSTGSVSGQGNYTGGLVGINDSATITNCYSTGSVTGQGDRTGGLVGYNYNNSTITNCYSTGSVSGQGDRTGGLVGSNYTNSTITNCYSTGSVTGLARYTGGLVGVNNSATITNSYSTGCVSGHGAYAGGLVGMINSSTDCEINGCVAYGKVITSNLHSGSLIGCIRNTADGVNFSTINITNCQVMPSDKDAIGIVIDHNWAVVNGYDMSAWLAEISEVEIIDRTTHLQVGIQGDGASKISFDTNFKLDFSCDITSDSALDSIDEFLNLLSEKSTMLGSVSNRLESVLDEIEIQYTNLVSSRSTIRDADIAKVSAEYIQQQILQQAAATLMSTANQSPAIALQLI
jgi:flagellin-like hook-associated protein FlgL